MPPVDAMVASQHAMEDQTRPFAQALAHRRALDQIPALRLGESAGRDALVAQGSNASGLESAWHSLQTIKSLLH